MRRRALLRVLTSLTMSLSATSPIPAQGPTLSAQPAFTFHPHEGILRELAFSPDGGTLATSSVDGTVKLWRLVDGRRLRTLVHPAGVTSLAFSADGRALATGSS